LAANVFPHPMDPTQGIVLGASPGTAVITVTGSVTGLKATASITVRYWLNVSQVTGATPVYEPGIYLKEDTHIPGPGTYPGGELSPSGGWGNDTDALDIYYYGDSDLTSRPNFMVSWIVDPDDPNSYVASAYGGFRRFTNITGGSQALVTVVGIYTIAGGNLTYEGLSGPTVFQNTIDFNLDNAAK